MAVRLSRWALDNPVVTKELRSRMRGARTYWLLFGYLLLLSLTLFLAYLAWWSSRSVTEYYGGGAAGFTVGRQFFQILFSVQAVLMALITPALTAGAISVEREQRTFDLLRSTTLPARSIVLGKLASSVSFVVLLLTSSVPLVSVCFLLGGVSPGEVFFAYLLLVCDAFLFGAMGLAWSASVPRTATATALSYATLFLYFLATLPLAAPAWSGGYVPGVGLSALNPIGAVLGAVSSERYYGLILPAWPPALALNGLLGILLTLVCVNRLEDFPARRAGWLRGLALLYVGLTVLLADGMILGGRGGAGPTQVSLLLIVAFGAVALFVPVFVTGDREEWCPSAYPLATLLLRWTPRGVFGNATLPSGLPYALLLTALTLGLGFAAVHASPSAFTAATGAVYGVLWQAAGLLLAVTVGIAGLGFLLSVLLGSRWSSLAILYLVLVLGIAMPYFTYANVSDWEAPRVRRSPAVNSLYLCPPLGLIQSAASLDPRARLTESFAVLPGLAFYRSLPIWEVTATVYLLLGAASYAAGFALLGRRE